MCLICNLEATIVANFIWIGFEWFEIYCKTKGVFFSEYSVVPKED